MKNFGKALKLYCKVTFNPITVSLGILIMGGLLVGAVMSPETPESSDYMSMIATVGFGQFGIIGCCLLGGTTVSRYRYCASLPFAKTLFTVVPTVFSAVAALIYDNIAVTIAAFCWCEQGLSDILIIAPLNSFIICLAVACFGKPKLEPMYIIPILVLATEQIVLPHISLTEHGFGLPVFISAVIGFLIFIAGVAFTLLIMNIWWEKCDHTYRGNYNNALNKI